MSKANNKIILGFVLGLGLTLYLLLEVFELGSVSWHQKITIEVETPEGIKTGSTVMKVKRSGSGKSPLPGIGGSSTEVEGEALVMEVAPGKYLFLLLKNSFAFATVSFRKHFPNNKRLNLPLHEIESYKELASLKNISVPLDYPRDRLHLISFEDINDPKTALYVDPTDISQIFGDGFRIKSLNVEIVDEPITRGRVREVSAWWDKAIGYLGGDHFDPNNPAHNLLHRDFIRRAKS